MEAKEDRFFKGKIKIVQPRRGYRFSLDAVLLSSWVVVPSQEFSLELGGGFGPASLMVKFLNPEARIISIDIQENYLKLFKKSINLNGFNGIYPLVADVKSPPFRKKFKVIFTNPPYMSPERYRVSPKLEVALSKYEIAATLRDFIKCTAQLLAFEGKAYFIVGSEREDFAEMSRENGLNIEEVLEIYEDELPKFRIFTLTGEKASTKTYEFKMKEGGKYTYLMERVLEGEKLRSLI